MGDLLADPVEILDSTGVDTPPRSTGAQQLAQHTRREAVPTGAKWHEEPREWKREAGPHKPLRNADLRGQVR